MAVNLSMSNNLCCNFSCSDSSLKNFKYEILKDLFEVFRQFDVFALGLAWELKAPMLN
jgi:hypothetical protein